MISTKTDISNAIEISFQRVAAFINQLDKIQFEECPGGKWSAGQQLDHLIRSVQPLNLAFFLPKFILPLLFGKMNRVPRNFDELLEKYSEKLANGGKASARFIPPVVYFNQREAKIKTYLKEKEKLLRRFQTFTDHQLDNDLLPHPLLGKLTVREMMFFTIFHTEHHLNTMQKM